MPPEPQALPLGALCNAVLVRLALNMAEPQRTECLAVLRDDGVIGEAEFAELTRRAA